MINNVFALVSKCLLAILPEIFTEQFISTMTTQQLQNVLILAKKLHFTKAAEEIAIVQPALSRQIKQLEEEVGAKLFRRNKRSVVLTEAGAYFIGEVEKIMHQIHRVKERTGQIHRGEAGAIRIGFTHSVMQTILPEILKKIHTHLPGMKTILKELNNKTQYQGLLNGTLDLGFATNPLVPAGLKSKILHVDNFVVLLPIHHPVSEDNFSDFSIFAEEEFIFPSPSDGIHYVRQIEAICLEAGFTPKIIHETDSASTGFRLIEAGLGISLEPISSLRGLLLPLKQIELKNVRQKAELTMLWREDLEQRHPKLFELLENA